MSKGCKIFATLLVLCLCMGANLYAERVRQVGVQSNEGLDLSALQELGITLTTLKPFDINKVVRTGDRTATTEDGTPIAFAHYGDKTTLTFGDQKLSFYANGAVPISDPETYLAVTARTLTFTDPLTQMPINVSGAVKFSDFEDISAPQKEIAQSNEYDRRMATYRDARSRIESSGVASSTIDVGGVKFDIYANGAVLFNPALIEDMLTMDPSVLRDLQGGQLPVAMPMYTVENGSLLFPNGSARRTLPD